MTSGSLVALPLPLLSDDGAVLVSSCGGSSRPPVLPPSRPSLLLPELEGLGLPLLWLPFAEPLVALGAGVSWPGEPVDSSLRPGDVRCPRGGRPGQQRAQRADLFVYGLEDRRDLVTDVAELYGQPVAQRAPGLAVRLGEGGQGLDGAQ